MNAEHIDLQTRLAFQEHALHQLSEQMALQAETLRLVQRQLQLLSQKYRELKDTDSQSAALPVQERPPHY